VVSNSLCEAVDQIFFFFEGFLIGRAPPCVCVGSLLVKLDNDLRLFSVHYHWVTCSDFLLCIFFLSSFFDHNDAVALVFVKPDFGVGTVWGTLDANTLTSHTSDDVLWLSGLRMGFWFFSPPFFFGDASQSQLWMNSLYLTCSETLNVRERQYWPSLVTSTWAVLSCCRQEASLHAAGGLRFLTVITRISDAVLTCVLQEVQWLRS
jgi:hypothetical protein